MDFFKKTVEDVDNRVSVEQEYPVIMYKKQKSLPSDTNALEELPLGLKDSKVFAEERGGCASKPEVAESAPSEKGESDQVLIPHGDDKGHGNHDGSSDINTAESSEVHEWFTCKSCELVFHTKKSYLAHKRMCYLEGEQVCLRCGKGFTNLREKKDHMKAFHKVKKKHLCEVCGKDFPYQCNLKMHKATHTKLKHFYCHKCGKGFACRSNLNSHAVTHFEEKPFQCEECGRRFLRISTLRFHKRTHTNERPYKCDACGKTFTQPSSLKTHQKLHSGDRPYDCNICKEKFDMKTALQSHMRTHTKERPFNCELSSKRFTQSTALKNHSKTHARNDKISDAVHDSQDPENDQSFSKEKSKMHRCELCGQYFALKNTLKIHMMRHTGERPHKCDVCPKSFTQSSTLKIHMRTHTGDKPYACSMCDAHFAYNYVLQKHILKHKEVGEMGKEEFSEQENHEDNVKLRTGDKNIVKQSYNSAVKHEESSRNVNRKKSDHGETNITFNGGEDQEKNKKKITPIDFLAAFQSSFKASSN